MFVGSKWPLSLRLLLKKSCWSCAGRHSRSRERKLLDSRVPSRKVNRCRNGLLVRKQTNRCRKRSWRILRPHTEPGRTESPVEPLSITGKPTCGSLKSSNRTCYVTMHTSVALHALFFSNSGQSGRRSTINSFEASLPSTPQLGVLLLDQHQLLKVGGVPPPLFFFPQKKPRFLFSGDRHGTRGDCSTPIWMVSSAAYAEWVKMVEVRMFLWCRPAICNFW